MQQQVAVRIMGVSVVAVTHETITYVKMVHHHPPVYVAVVLLALRKKAQAVVPAL